jgi:hypothetical protein
VQGVKLAKGFPGAKPQYFGQPYKKDVTVEMVRWAPTPY